VAIFSADFTMACAANLCSTATTPAERCGGSLVNALLPLMALALGQSPSTAPPVPILPIPVTYEAESNVFLTFTLRLSPGTAETGPRVRLGGGVGYQEALHAQIDHVSDKGVPQSAQIGQVVYETDQARLWVLLAAWRERQQLCPAVGISGEWLLTSGLAVSGDVFVGRYGLDVRTAVRWYPQPWCQLTLAFDSRLCEWTVTASLLR
jgi:hypothetical protein